MSYKSFGMTLIFGTAIALTFCNQKSEFAKCIFEQFKLHKGVGSEQDGAFKKDFLANYQLLIHGKNNINLIPQQGGFNMLQKLRGNSQGFTLIELMIVIAIIGILAAIAIPNFIAYRNKTFCTRTESDATGISASIADYFSIPDWVRTPTLGQLNNGVGYTLSGNNTALLTGADPTVNITIIVTDGSQRCPSEYKGAMSSTGVGDDGWAGTATTDAYRKYMSP